MSEKRGEIPLQTPKLRLYLMKMPFDLHDYAQLNQSLMLAATCSAFP
jgi:hypothetical protein